jgi:mono/diheme cytochrome c family protein
VANEPAARLDSRLVHRPALIVLAVLFLAGCGGEKVIAPTGPVEGALPKAAKGNPVAGKKLFIKNGCNNCHTFKAANATGTTGPNLDKVLQGKDAQFVQTSIIDPGAFVEKGYPNLMPTTYGSQLTAKQVADLVAFLLKQK